MRGQRRIEVFLSSYCLAKRAAAIMLVCRSQKSLAAEEPTSVDSSKAYSGQKALISRTLASRSRDHPKRMFGNS